MEANSKCIESEQHKKHKKVFVIPVANAVVDESAVMVKTFNTLVAVVTVTRVFRPKILTLNTEVVKMI